MKRNRVRRLAAAGLDRRDEQSLPQQQAGKPLARATVVVPTGTASPAAPRGVKRSASRR
ncbi:MAG TPA: hypothetical protein VHQ65_06400 [Thermoanaerobaculia bacterium]|nr:hypothetical protein [Thermoanaerobaculia bacterium]